MAQSGVFFKTLSMWSSSRFLLNNSFSKLQVNGLSNSARLKLKELNIPEKPKKPYSPYTRFVKENQIILAKNHPDWKQTDIFKKCAEDWKTVSADKKQKLAESYKADKQQYDKAILHYQASLTPEQTTAMKKAAEEKKKSKEHKEKRKMFKETNKPKRPTTSYMLFLMEESKMRNMALKDLMVECKHKWANLSDSDKEKYFTQFQKEKQAYEAEMKVWEDKMIKTGHEDLVRSKSLKEKRPSRIKQVKSVK